MVIYHFGWNLSFLELISVDLRDYPAWVWFGHAIAASFLALWVWGWCWRMARVSGGSASCVAWR